MGTTRHHDRRQAPLDNRAYRLGALAASTIVLLTAAAAAWVYATQRPGVDYASFWAAGRLVLLGEPLSAYDIETHRAVEMTVATMGGLMPFPYPPPFLFLVAPFGFHPFWLSYLAWIAVTGALYVGATRLLVPPRFALAHPGGWVTAVIGQNGFLTSSILLFGIALLASSPLAGGAVLGLLVVKPQLAVLVPVALLAAREWRAIAGAALSSLSLLAVAAIVFGLESYTAFLAMSREYAGYMADGRWNWAEQASVFGMLRYFGVPQAAALAGQAAAALAAAALTWRAWAARWDSRGAVLLSAALLVPPYLFTYDSLLLIAPLAALLREPERPWRPTVVWALLLLPVLGYLGLYPGPNTVPVAAALCLWWMMPAEAKRKAAAPSGTAAPSSTRV